MQNQLYLCVYPTFSKHLILNNEGKILKEKITQLLLIIPVSVLFEKKNKVEQSGFSDST